MENKNDENETIAALRVIKIEKLEKKNFGEKVNDVKLKSFRKFKEKNFLKRQLKDCLYWAGFPNII
jgi:hypothetical protein